MQQRSPACVVAAFSGAARACAVWVVAGLAGVGAALPPPLPSVPLPQAQPQQELANARMTFEAKAHDFGQIWDTEPVETKFKFTNSGSEPLKITDIRSSCGCTVPELPKRVFEPGESGELTVIFNPSGKVGVNNRSITIVTNDASSPNHIVSVKVDVKKLVYVEPAQVNFGRLDKGQTLGRKAVIIGRPEDFSVKPVAEGGVPEGFSIKISDPVTVERDGVQMRSIEIDVTALGTLAVGRSRGVLALETSDPRLPRVEIPLVALVSGDLSAEPARVQFGVIQPGESVDSTFRVVNRSGKAFGVKGVEIRGTLGDEGTVKATFEPEPGKNNSVYLVRVQGPVQTKRQHIGRIAVLTDIADEPEVLLYYYGSVGDPRELLPAGETGVQPGDDEAAGGN